MNKFSTRLRELRRTKELSQQKLSDILGISKSSINMYERGEREPGLFMLESIADFFNVDVDYLLGISDIPNKVLYSGEKVLYTSNNIIDKYNKLNAEGKQKADEYITDLSEQKKYTVQNQSFNAPPRKIAAFGAKGTKGEVKPKTRKTT